MGLISRFFLGNDYDDGYDTAKEYNKQGGSMPASDDTIVDLHWSTSPDAHYEEYNQGWRDYEDNQRTFWQWLTNK